MAYAKCHNFLATGECTKTGFLPHFIFNVLNREMNLHKGEEESQNLIGLTKLIRRNLELTDCLAVSLADELEFVDTYVGTGKGILGKRF